MARANIGELRSNLRDLLARVAAGEEIEIRKRNVPIARIVPLPAETPNQTRLGCGEGSVIVKTDLTAPVWSQDDWDMMAR